jgi:MarR family transcriptional regulator, lower aerobic nicotinate degradation pathway regulator
MAARPRQTPAPPEGDSLLTTVDALAQLSFLIQGILGRQSADHQLSIIQTRLLGILRDRQPTMNELAKLLGLDKSSVTGLVDRAERRGLVVRRPSTADRRAVQVHLTDDGRSLVSQAAAEFDHEVTALLDDLQTGDRRQLTRLITQVLVKHAASHGVDLLATTSQ